MRYDRKMTKKARTLLFAACLTLFALAAPIIIGYSQGYRFDFATKRIVQTGGIYVKAMPRNVNVYINGKFKKTTSIFTNSCLMENLIPKTYNVEVKKQGYHTWQKNLTVWETQVTEAKNILLIPENPNFTILTSDEQEIIDITSQIDCSTTSSDKKKVIEADDHEIWISFVKTQNNQEESLGESEDKIFLNRFSEKIDKVCWLNNYYLIFNIGDEIKIAEIDDRNKINMVDLLQFPSPEIFWDEENSKLYVLSEDNLYVSANLLP